ncbi:type II toxin-antitoxin system VapC family toxin [Methylocaldum sp. BRCS4]|uniref:type II toxin-antitoxin system VapC family toxin n=1 Tax=Methylocaldum sp. 14B TaxID=1912213 RepID=UPI00098AEBC1|nr:type II toxin-antitoxin system VapC family toxin [Methylocaldum sp. 14B]MVF23670.1 type II toxin-antitoxin system VapC family toxin [Methylocaldum sp. BRCS4]
MIVPDTNTLIYFFKGQGKVAERLLQTPPGELALPAIVLYELEVGIAKSNAPERRRAQLGELLAWVEVLPFGALESRCSALIRADLEKRGEPIGPMDVLIAGTAFAHDALLITRNLSEFGRIPGLRLENWYD